MAVVRIIFWALAVAWVVLYSALGIQHERIEHLERRYAESLLSASPRASRALQQWLDVHEVSTVRKRGVATLSYEGPHNRWVSVVNRLVGTTDEWMSWSTQTTSPGIVKGELKIKNL